MINFDVFTNALRLWDCTVGGNAGYNVPVQGSMSAYDIRDALRDKGIPVKYLGIVGDTIIFNVPKEKKEWAERVMSDYQIPFSRGAA